MKPVKRSTVLFKDDKGHWQGGTIRYVYPEGDFEISDVYCENVYRRKSNEVVYAPTLEECLEKYPRLVRVMQAVAILSSYEATASLRDYFRREVYGGIFAGEAVSHFGGTLEVIKRAITRRHSYKKFNGNTYGYPRGHSKFKERTV